MVVSMLKHRWDCSERRTPLVDVSLIDQLHICQRTILILVELAAPTVSPKAAEGPPLMGAGSNIYRQDNRPQQQFFDLDLDLNPDL